MAAPIPPTQPTGTNPELTEETPLLASTNYDSRYDRFTPARKKVIVALVSWCGLIPLFASGTFAPVMPDIARDLNTTGGVISFAVSLSIFVGCPGALAGASYSTFYGRRPIYLFALPLLVIGSIGVASAQTVPQLLAYRSLQALGAAPGASVGAGVIGDIYKLEERGTAMGLYFAANLLGLALAPPIGGFASEYFSWRILQAGLSIAGFLAFLMMVCFFPETCHPGTRGVDKLCEEEGGAERKRWRFVWLNPLKPLALLRSPNLLAVSVAGFCILVSDMVMLVPLAYTIGPKYGITNSALIGLCFIPAGCGKMIGAPLAGRLSDSIVVNWRKKRNGVWYPEDRLRATMIGATTLVPLSVLGAGWTMELVPGKAGLVLCLFWLFVSGVGVDMVLSPSSAYAVDVMHKRSAESVAANSGFRVLLIAPVIAGILPCIDTFGVGWTNTFAAAVSVLGCILLMLVIRYGEEMRAWSDVGYSTADTN